MIRLLCLLLMLSVTLFAQASDRDDWEFGVRAGGMITDNALRLDG